MGSVATPLLILYGSQTGNAQDVAECIAREARLLLFDARVLAMDAYPVAGLPAEPAVVFVASTTGQGDPPDNMRRFWRFLLRKSLAADSLAGLRYAVFGLGDSAYVKYNAAAKKLDRRLAALGARPVIERGLGDDQHSGGYDAALDPWLQRLWPALREAFPLPPGAPLPVLDAASRLQLGPPKFRVTLLETPGDARGGAGGAAAQGDCGGGGMDEEELLQREAVEAAAAFRAVASQASGLPPSPDLSGAGAAAYGPWRPFMAPLLVNRRLTSVDHFQDTRHLEFDLVGSGMEGYEPGDLLAIFPRTPEADVQAVLSRLGLDARQLIRVEASPQGGRVGSEGAPAPALVATAHAIVQGVLDVSGASPRRYLFQALRHYATLERERERLTHFASPEGRDELYEYNQKEHRTLLEVLRDFPSASPLPLERLLEAAPILQPRYFSMSSSPLAHPGRAHVTAAVVRYATPFKRQKRGLVTTWLAGLAAPQADSADEAGLSPGGGEPNVAAPPPPAAGADAAGAEAPKVPVWVERGCLRMPPSPSVPLLLVGPGTGVAPFRSFLWQRAAILQQQQQQEQQQAGDHGHAAAPPAACVPRPAPCVLFFGCRGPSLDFYYQDEWQRLQQLGALDPSWGLVAAFSRPGGPGAGGDGLGQAVGAGRKEYVTHKIKEHGEQVWDLVAARGASIYISGSAKKMPADVAAALEAVAERHGGLTRERAAQWVRQLETAGRYHVEAWS